MPVVKKVGRPASEALWTQRTDEILDAAVTLFAERGFDRADTQELADRLGVGKGTIYRYFPSKRDLFLAAADRAMTQLRESVNSQVDVQADPLEQIAQGIQAYLAFFEAHPEYVELLIQERAQFKDRKKPTYFEHRDKNIGRWNQLLQSLIAAGRVRDLPAERINSVVSDLVYGTMFTNYFTGRRQSLSMQAGQILDLVFHGILTDSERKRLRRGRP